MTKNREKDVEVNPFLASFSIKPVIKYTEWAVTKGGDAPLGSSIKLPRDVDLSRGSWYEAMDFDNLHEFSKPALQVLGHILSHLRWNQDYIELKPSQTFNPEYPKLLVMSKSSFYNGVSDLAARGVIASRVKRAATYWINPAKFFFGNRLDKFSEYVIRFKPSEDIEEPES